MYILIHVCIYTCIYMHAHICIYLYVRYKWRKKTACSSHPFDAHPPTHTHTHTHTQSIHLAWKKGSSASASLLFIHVLSPAQGGGGRGGSYRHIIPRRRQRGGGREGELFPVENAETGKFSKVNFLLAEFTIYNYSDLTFSEFQSVGREF